VTGRNDGPAPGFCGARALAIGVGDPTTSDRLDEEMNGEHREEAAEENTTRAEPAGVAVIAYRIS
jgi:hypothetical protein